jgi:hypothetical protein
MVPLQTAVLQLVAQIRQHAQVSNALQARRRLPHMQPHIVQKAPVGLQIMPLVA